MTRLTYIKDGNIQRSKHDILCDNILVSVVIHVDKAHAYLYDVTRGANDEHFYWITGGGSLRNLKSRVKEVLTAYGAQFDQEKKGKNKL